MSQNGQPPLAILTNPFPLRFLPIFLFPAGFSGPGGGKEWGLWSPLLLCEDPASLHLGPVLDLTSQPYYLQGRAQSELGR